MGFRRTEAPAAASWACSAWRSRTWIQIITECPREAGHMPGDLEQSRAEEGHHAGIAWGPTSGRRLGQYFGVEAARGRKFARIPYSLATSRHFLALQAYICRTVQLRGDGFNQPARQQCPRTDIIDARGGLPRPTPARRWRRAGRPPGSDGDDGEERVGCCRYLASKTTLPVSTCSATWHWRICGYCISCGRSRSRRPGMSVGSITFVP